MFRSTPKSSLFLCGFASDIQVLTVSSLVCEQTDVTLWRLKVFVQEALKAANKSSGGTNAQNNNNTGTGEINKNNAKRRREISDAINKASIKRAKKA